MYRRGSASPKAHPTASKKMPSEVKYESDDRGHGAIVTYRIRVEIALSDPAKLLNSTKKRAGTSQ